MTDRWERTLRSVLAPVRELEPTEDEVRRVLAIDSARRRRRLRPPLWRAVLAAGAVLIVGSGVAYAVPVTRGVIDDVYGAVASWVGGGAAPGRALRPGEDAPPWVATADGERRVVAENGPARLYAIRTGDTVEFALGGSVGLRDSITGWRSQLAGHGIVSLGPGSFDGRPFDDHDRRPLFGLVAANIKRIELRYASGPPTTQSDLDGGYALLADARRQPRLLVGFDSVGREVARLDVGYIELRVCGDPAGCPPGKLTP